MDFLEALILGVLQGLTEFLPVSSSGHLELGETLLGIKAKDPTLFAVIVHGATALSTIFVFRERIVALSRSCFHGGPHSERTYALKILISMVPAGLVGLLFKEELEAFFSGRPILVGAMLLITALLLFLSNRWSHGQRKLAYGTAFIIGVAQAFALMPGISRSGATISTSLLLGVGRERAAEFSFLMVIPLLLGAMGKKLLDVIGTELGSNISLGPLVLGFAAAFLSGVLACKWMLRIVARARLSAFAIYCCILGILAIVGAFMFGNT
ncbi:MAG: undecaprenyl-diphosphate phosphatase [Flavobacteriales bacterium]